MAYKFSSALLAAIVVVAGPAFAQDSSTSASDAVNEAAQQAADSAEAAAGDAAAAVEKAADDAKAAAMEAVEGAAQADGAAGTDAEMADGEKADGDMADGEMADGEMAKDAAPAEASAETAEPMAAETSAEAPATEQPAADGAPTAPQVGAYYLKSTHGDWTLRCIKADEGQPDPCELYQLLKDDQGNSVAEVTMIPLNQGEAAAGATIVTPLETDLIRGLGLKVDSAAMRGYPFNFCAPVGCVVRMGFDASGLNGLKRGNVATVSLLPFGADPENPVELPMSLTGFTAAFTELEGIVAEARAQLEAAPAN